MSNLPQGSQRDSAPAPTQSSHGGPSTHGSPIDRLRFNEAGLVPSVVQDARTGKVLMLAWLDREALDRTLDTGSVHFWSRSRQQLWRKGETSGNTLALVDLAVDCDSDALLIRADPAGPTCHTGQVSCFGDAAAGQGFAYLEDLWETITRRRQERPDDSYTVRLLDGGTDACVRKVLEEAGEVVLAAKDHATGSARGDGRRLAEEAADLIYHLLVLLAERRQEPSGLLGVLRERA